VEWVSWYDAIVFCNKLSMAEGLSPAYRISGSTDPADWGTVPTSSNATWNAAEIVSGSIGYRLPTEAQWEYAAKGGDPSAAEWAGYTYSGSDTIGDVAWYSVNSGGRTHEVGKKLPNGLGLYDMSGNVCEWCWDWHGDYSSEEQTDPAGSNSEPYRVIRGGSGNGVDHFTRSVFRTGNYVSSESYDVGFRLARPDSAATPPRTVTYNGNGGTGTAPAPQAANAGTAITLAGGAGLSKNGYIFGGWNANANGMGTNYPAGTSYTVTGNIILYAQWIPVGEMVYVPGGTFQMGQELGTAVPGDITPPGVTPVVHTVTLTGFYIGKYQVTQARYQEIMGKTILELQALVTTSESNYGRGNDYPVYWVNWYSAIVFCNKLSMAEGLSPAYRISGSTDPVAWGEVPASYVSSSPWNSAEIVSGSTGYRLPTEAQWEYAAKGGNQQAAGWAGYTYSGSDTIDDVAWYVDNSNNMTHEVGKKQPNSLGIYDMNGNVGEWCWDWKGAYSSGAQTDPAGPASGSNRVLRGAGYSSNARPSVFAPSGDTPYERYNNYGIRLVRP
jgi:uncharacterized repeat protein (TIGR02543 family)